MADITPHQVALNKAKIQLMQRPDSAFFTTVCFSLRHIWDDKIPTACTNGKWIRFSPKFFMSLDPQEQLFLLIHESMHVAYMHMVRLMDRDPHRWNVAADYVINLQLVERGFKMPSVGLLDTQYAGMSTEEVYKKLPEKLPPIDIDLELGESDDETLTQDIQDILIRAQIQSKMSGDKPGSIPGDIEIYLNGLLNPQLKWTRILQKYLNAANSKADYSFRKPNRRFFPKYHMPSLHSESLGSIAVAVDTSGSVSDYDFKVFVSEVAGIFRMMNPELITLLQFDTEIKSIDKLKSLADLKDCKFTGRGGTLITPVLEWAKVNRPQLLLVFSDGGFNFYDTTVNTDVLWVIHNNPGWTAPFGKVINYTVKETA